MAAPKAQTFSSVPPGLEALIQAHLPQSLPLLRRLQFAKYHGWSTPQSRIIFVAEGDISDSLSAFTAVYLDLSVEKETQMWLYSTLEDDKGKQAGNPIYRAQLEELTREVIKLSSAYGKGTYYAGGLLLGTLNTHVRRILENMKRISPRTTGYYDKWLFKDTDIPGNDVPLPEGMKWDTASFEDCKIVVSRTDIPRTPETLVGLPSQIIRLQDGTPISWAFLGQDGSLVSLHCEEPYRCRGLAKALAARLMRRGPGDFANDGWSSADVSSDNAGSRGICKSLNGTIHWEVSWVLFNVTKDGVAEV